MKNKIIYVILMVCICCLNACQDENEHNINADDSGLTLSLQTRAQDDTDGLGEDTYNENLIKFVNVYFFDDINSEYVFKQEKIPVSNDNKLKVKIDQDMYGKTYTVYVVANAPESFTSSNGDDLADLKGKVITTEWNTKGMEATLLMDAQMDNISIDKGGSKEVMLKRAMAKVTLTPEVEPIVEVGGVTYSPDLKTMKVTFVNAVKKTQLDGKYVIGSNDDYITRIQRTYSVITEGKYAHIPFYSYPNPENTVADIRKESYLILCVPWRATTGEETTYEDYYYYVPITSGITTLEPNRYYKVNVKVGMLGSLNPNEAVRLEDVDFRILDWNDMELDTEMSQYQYLVLDDYKTELYNQETVTMPYISSSSIVLGSGANETRIVSVEYIDYANNVDITKGTIELTENQIPADYKIETIGDRLRFTHPISDDMYVSYKISVSVWNEQGINRIWTIIQYPSIYIEGKKAEGRLFVNGTYSSRGDKVNVYYDDHALGSVRNPSTITGSLDGNNNYNNYTVSVSAFRIGDDFAIGDPRELIARNLDMDKHLSNYRPTRNQNTDKIIAPIFKIASSRGKTTNVSFENAERRCAAYQEDGYPAGRWRVPTEAEIQFIINLSADNKIPELFDGDYWSASGRYYTSSNQSFSGDGVGDGNPSSVSGSHAVRCVYDIWYWGEDQIDVNTFEWRD